MSQTYEQALEDVRAHHQRSKTYSGSLALFHVQAINQIVEAFNAQTILDYGCGKGLQYDPPHRVDEVWGVPVTKYDPGWPPYQTEPRGKFDLVICTHVLGCVPTIDLPTFLDRLYCFAAKAVYVGELIGPTKKRVFRNPERFPHGWSREMWASELDRAAAVPVFLGTVTPPSDIPFVRQVSGPEA